MLKSETYVRSLERSTWPLGALLVSLTPTYLYLMLANRSQASSRLTKGLALRAVSPDGIGIERQPAAEAHELSRAQQHSVLAYGHQHVVMSRLSV